ncbi:MAG TPA: arginase family protein [Candidatus Paceibacterota bacterium]
MKKETATHLTTKKARAVSVTIIPIPFGDGVGETGGAVDTPKYLLRRGFAREFARAGFSVKQCPAITTQKMSPMTLSARGAVARELKLGRKCVALGGTHTISLGTIGGALEVFGDDLGLIWVDAHGDLNTHAISLTKDMRGMVFASLLGLDKKISHALVPRKLNKKNALHIGLKDADEAEIQLIQKNSLSVVTMGDMVTHGMSYATSHVKRLVGHTKYLWVSIDVDAIEKNDAPASAMASHGGLTYREIAHLAKYIGDSGNVVGVDIAEMTPNKDVRGKTAGVCLEIASSLLGAPSNWYTRYMDTYTK